MKTISAFLLNPKLLGTFIGATAFLFFMSEPGFAESIPQLAGDAEWVSQESADCVGGEKAAPVVFSTTDIRDYEKPPSERKTAFRVGDRVFVRPFFQEPLAAMLTKRGLDGAIEFHWSVDRRDFVKIDASVMKYAPGMSTKTKEVNIMLPKENGQTHTVYVSVYGKSANSKTGKYDQILSCGSFTYGEGPRVKNKSDKELTSTLKNVSIRGFKPQGAPSIGVLRQYSDTTEVNSTLKTKPKRCFVVAAAVDYKDALAGRASLGSKRMPMKWDNKKGVLLSDAQCANGWSKELALSVIAERANPHYPRTELQARAAVQVFSKQATKAEIKDVLQKTKARGEKAARENRRRVCKECFGDRDSCYQRHGLTPSDCGL